MKKRLNVKLVAWLLGTVLSLAVGTYFLHGYQAQRNAAALRHLAEEAAHANDLVRAGRYYRLYLVQHPADIESLARYAVIQIKLAKTTRARSAALLTLEQVLRRLPENHDVRRLLVEQAMRPDLQQFADAKVHLAVLCRVFPREAELQHKLGCCETELGNFAAAAAAHGKAIELAPTLIEAYRDLADLQTVRLKAPAAAAKTLKLLVSANPGQARTWLYRARHLRAQGGLEPKDEDRKRLFSQAAADLARAANLAEQDADVLLESVELAIARDRLEQARACVQRGRQFHAQDARFRLAGERVEAKVKQRREAVAFLHRKLDHGPEHEEVLWVLANMAIDEEEWQEAEIIEGKLRRSGAAAPLLDCLKARVLVKKGEWLEASRRLKNVRSRLTRWPETAVQADLLLARCHAQLGDSGQQELALRRALGVTPQSEVVRLSLGEALLATGKHMQAHDVFRSAANSTRARLRAARALVIHHLSLPPGQRGWNEVERFLDAIAQASADDVEVALLRADVFVGKNQLARAADELAMAMAMSPENARVGPARAALLQRQERWQEALALLDEAEDKLGQRIELSLARARFWAERGGSEAPAALQQLAVKLNQYEDMDWRRLAHGLAEAWLVLGQNKEAAGLYARLAETDPQDLSARLALVDVLLATPSPLPLSQGEKGSIDAASRLASGETGRGEAEQVRQIIADMRRIEGDEGAYWRLGEACRLLQQARQARKEPDGQVRQLLTAAAARKSSWSRLALAEADWQELSGRPQDAICTLQKAIDAGARDPNVFWRAAMLLYQCRRYVEADEVLQRLQPPARPLLFGVERAAEFALFHEDGDPAWQRARQAGAADSRDYRELLWRGHVLCADEKWSDAEVVFRRAVDSGGKAPETWLALMRCLVRIDRQHEAAALLARAGAALPADLALLALAQGHEILDHAEKAGELYEAAHKARPQDAAVLRNLARFLMRVGRLNDARRYLRIILELDGSSADDEAWARRHLASS